MWRSEGRRVEVLLCGRAGRQKKTGDAIGDPVGAGRVHTIRMEGNRR
jgi:hypothetical protein